MMKYLGGGPEWILMQNKQPEENTRLIVRIKDEKGIYEAVGRYIRKAFRIHPNRSRKTFMNIKTIGSEKIIAWYPILDYSPIIDEVIT